MVINIASFGGRTHMLDTARELAKLGHKVRFYSYVPTKRAMQFGLPKECSYTLFWWALPFLCLFKLFGFRAWIQNLYFLVFDHFTGLYMKPCDVFIGQSPMHFFSLKMAKKRFGATAILERGNSHELEMIKHIQDNPIYKGKPVMPAFWVRRDLKGYDIADYISVGSDHVAESFTKHDIPRSRIFVNNYGANLSFFHPTELASSNVYDVIFVGQWCYRKGCDMLIKAVEELGLKLLHVGCIVDVEFPHENNLFTHIDSVNEMDLLQYYQHARISIMPSREEGLSLVQPQALACGLPLVCSKYSGGRDLKKYLTDPSYILEMDDLTIEDIKKNILLALEKAKLLHGVRNLLDDKGSLSFAAYGKRYDDFLKEIL